MSAEAQQQLAAASGEIARLRAQLEAANAHGNQVLAQLQQAQAAAAVAAPRAVSKLKAPPAPVFRGDVGVAVDTWLRGMRKLFDFYGNSEFADDAARVKYAAMHLEGSALLWWEGHPQRATIATLAAFEAALHQRFRPIEADHIARERLAGMKQRGRVSDYADRFQRELLPIKDMAAADQVAYFLRGLDAHLQAKAREKKPTTLGDAVNAAVEAEAYARDSTGRAYAPRGSSYYASNAAASSASAHAPMDISNVNQEEATVEEYYEQEAASGPSRASASVAAASPASAIARADPSAALLAMMQDMQQRLNALSSGAGGSGPPRQGDGSAANRGAQDRVPGLSREDIDRLRREGRCFKCKKAGHTKRDCTDAPRLKW
jgi:hypothetical protein